MKTALLIIDPQNDFTDPDGSLFVPGANVDMKRLTQFIGNNSIDDILVTMDSHSEVDIAHPVYWHNKEGKLPEPFTLITLDDVKNQRWMPRNSKWADRSLAYVEALAKSGKYQLTIWPPHCITGSWGQAVYPELSDGLREWEKENFKGVKYINKGLNTWTEHYSAVKAEVVDPQDPHTDTNIGLLERLQDPDIEKILIAGEALSHCVASTVRDLAEQFSPENIGKLTLLTNCCSSVPGCEALGEKFICDLVSLGMKLESAG